MAIYALIDQIVLLAFLRRAQDAQRTGRCGTRRNLTNDVIAIWEGIRSLRSNLRRRCPLRA